MKVKFRDIRPEEAAVYGEGAEFVLKGRKAVEFTDEDGHVGVTYMKSTDIATLGEQYITKNAKLIYDAFCEDWIPNISWDEYYNDPKKNVPITIAVEFVELFEGENAEIWKRKDNGQHLMRQLCREPFAKWFTCKKTNGRWEKCYSVRPNITFRNGDQTEMVTYHDWNETAAYSDTFNPNFREG